MTELMLNYNNMKKNDTQVSYLYLMENPNYKSLCKTSRYYTKKIIEDIKNPENPNNILKLNKKFQDYLEKFKDLEIDNLVFTDKFKRFLKNKLLIVSLEDTIETIQIYFIKPNLFKKLVKNYTVEQITDFFKNLMYISLILPNDFESSNSD